MSRRARVNAGGMITMPLAGDVRIGGLTLSAAQKLVEDRLKTYIINPHVTLFVEEYGNKLLFVMGEVQKPGSYPIPAETRMTLLEAISTAGGFTPVAAPDRTRVLRTVDGRSVSRTVDVRGITRAGEKDPLLEPNDVVFVPQSLF
jgi:polysaccharide export outer membrane protein